MAKFEFKNRRRNYFIKKEFQAKFILKFCILVILTALISAFLIYHFSGRSVTTVFEKSRIKIVPSTTFITPSLIISSLISVVLVGTATIIVVLFISHRIAGPLYKLESLLERMASGDVSFDVHLRRKDEIKELAEAFTEAVHGLNNLLCDAKKESIELGSVIKELKVLSEKLPTLPEDIKKDIEKLETAKNNLDDKLNKFRLR